MNRATSFLNEFRHWRITNVRGRPAEKTFLAGILGYGCFIGTRKIARILKAINESELDNTVNWYFSLDNIHAANDRILTLMDRLQLPDVYRRKAELIHTSSDGQKFEVAVDSLNANYSFKYFGQGKGVSAVNFIDERRFLFHSTVISSSEREAAYVIAGVLHNDVMKSDIHSTDTHGYTEVIFGVMHLLGFTYAPRITNLKNQTRSASPIRDESTTRTWVPDPSGQLCQRRAHRGALGRYPSIRSNNQAEGNDGFTALQTVQFLFDSASSLQGTEGVWKGRQINLHSEVH